VRYPGAVVDVQTRDFSATPGAAIELDFSLDAPAQLPAAALVERQVDWVWEKEEDMPDYLLILVYDDGEPSARARELLERYRDDPRMTYEDDAYVSDCADLTDWIRDDLKIKDTDQLPVVVLLKAGGGTLLYRSGFDLAIADWVEQALGREEISG
jgi:hypothetical protein